MRSLAVFAAVLLAAPCLALECPFGTTLVVTTHGNGQEERICVIETDEGSIAQGGYELVEHGQVVRAGQYDDGAMEGTWPQFDEEGDVTRVEVYEDDRLQQVIDAEDAP